VYKIKFKCEKCGNLLDEPFLRIATLRYKSRVRRGTKKQHIRNPRPNTWRVARIHHSYGDVFEIRCPDCGFVGKYEKIRR